MENFLMTKRRVETAVSVSVDRNFPAEAFGQAAKTLQSSGVVDQMLMWDQLTSWVPPCLWNEDFSPLAKVLPDLDSYPDWNVMCGYGVAQAPGLGTAISLDAIRRGPAEMTQTMLSLANITKGNSIYQVGAGELKQCKPFGWKRNEGLSRLEDFYKIYHAFMDSDKPINFEGNHTKLENAWLGVAKTHKPRIWGLGGGPKVYDMATSYADGFATMAPMVWTSPEDAARHIKQLKEQLESKGRDPEKFDFGIWISALLHEDDAVIERAYEGSMVKWSTCIMGRIIQSDWIKEGIEPPMPADWHYALKMLPVTIDRAEAERMLSRVTPEMSRKTWMVGTPKKVAAEVQGYIDAGVTWVAVLDMVPTILEPEESAKAVTRSIDVCRFIKENNKG
jgi:phthiodiolone/phenolphthiodiolone dimycocerosates ketoreductase